MSPVAWAFAAVTVAICAAVLTWAFRAIRTLTPADVQAIQDADDDLGLIEALWALPAHDPRPVDPIDEHAAQAIDITREDTQP
jgi:hypothetical protein